jgi:hypothetical protein
MSPILKSVLEAGAAYPMLRELMSFAKVDGEKLGEKAQSLLGELTGELGTILKNEETIKVAPVAPADVPVVDVPVTVTPMANGTTEAASVVGHGGE